MSNHANWLFNPPFNGSQFAWFGVNFTALAAYIGLAADFVNQGRRRVSGRISIGQLAGFLKIGKASKRIAPPTFHFGKA